MNALANVIKPEGGPMDVEATSQSATATEEEKKVYEARIEALNVPTPDELNNRVCILTQLPYFKL